MEVQSGVDPSFCGLSFDKGIRVFCVEKEIDKYGSRKTEDLSVEDEDFGLIYN